MTTFQTERYPLYESDMKKKVTTTIINVVDGKPGSPGKDGKDGKDGRDGKDGKNGRDGRDIDDSEYSYLKRIFKRVTDASLKVQTIMTELIGFVDASGKLRAFINGAAKGKEHMIAIGLDDEGQNPTGYLDPSGRAKLGPLYVEAADYMTLRKAPNLPAYVRYGGKLTKLRDLLNRSVKSSGPKRLDVHAGFHSFEENERVDEKSDIVYAYEDGGQLTVTGTISYLYDMATATKRQQEGFSMFFNAKIKNIDSGNTYVLFQRRIIPPYDGRLRDSRQFDINASHNVPVGHYRIVATAEVLYESDSGLWESSVEFRLSAKWEKHSDVKEIVYSEDGMSAYYGPDKLFYLTQADQPFLTIKGSVDMPGVLATGRMNANGSLDYKWGKATGGRHVSTGRYQVNHTIGHTNYTVTANATGTVSRNISVDVIRPYYFVVNIYSGYQLSNDGFSFHMIGDN